MEKESRYYGEGRTLRLSRLPLEEASGGYKWSFEGEDLISSRPKGSSEQQQLLVGKRSRSGRGNHRKASCRATRSEGGNATAEKKLGGLRSDTEPIQSGGWGRMLPTLLSAKGENH